MEKFVIKEAPTEEAMKDTIMDKLKEFFSIKTIKHEGDKWVLYSKDGSKRLGSFDSEDVAKKRESQIEHFKTNSEITEGFKVYTDKEGKLRWVSISSNSFEDKDKEIITTNALKEAIEYADEQGERGPLLLAHIPQLKIGLCDFQDLSGRFLIESGTFDDTPTSVKALDYFINSDKEHQVSIGFWHLKGDEEDGQYDWLRFKERSILPEGMAANPWTSFGVITGVSLMNEKKETWLKEVVGDEEVGKLKTFTETQSKELEATVRFKEKKEVDVTPNLTNLMNMIKALPEGDIRTQLEVDYNAVADAVGVEVKTEETKEETPASTTTAGDTTVTVTTTTETPSDISKLTEMISGLSGKIDELNSVKETVETLQNEIKELKKTDDEKMSEKMLPRFQINTSWRPSESDNNVITDEKVQKALKEQQGDQIVNPAQAYLDDLKRLNGSLAN